ncbi:hypothetical protein I6N95_25760 [Vagococcus sp. BWB3-3]|uniref:AbiTii domain-containing protein n=1 Tax=Vagococcus allomyrinae TaxID=2794353 RepID=A0A940P9V0_9ENTE|nr:hypothetical protein [Vagococcus allomyrinae]MBP1044419.1 hypothetical protein [Vagococcus allomyrinae]
MTKSQIIKDLATNKISLEETLQRLLIITNDLDINEIKVWISGELNGYSNITILPNYRKNVSQVIKYSGINGRFQMTNQTLPITAFPVEVREKIQNSTIIESISTIEKVLVDESKIGIDLTQFSGIIYEETGIKCYKIFQEYSQIALSSIVSNVKNKVLLILLDLEKEFGNLDSLDIESEAITRDKVEKIRDTFSTIYYDGVGEKYIG